MSERRARVAVLDDYQGVALRMADWSPIAAAVEVTVYRDHVRDPDALLARLEGFDVVCVMRERTPLAASILQRLPALRLIVTTSGWNASIDMAAAKQLGITVCGTPSYLHPTVELTWALILAFARGVCAGHASVHGGGWQVALGGNLHGRTLGIIGLGNLGSRVAAIAAAFGMNVIAWSEHLTPEVAAARGARYVSKDELLATADVITIHLKLSERTRHLIDAADFERMRSTAFIVNTSRGPIVSERALVEALRAKRIAGAALDVYDEEPLPAAHPLRALDNLIATPHIGYVSEDSYRVYYAGIVEDIRAWLDGTPIRVLE